METQERTYTTLDRTRWGHGAWDTEPDKVQFVDEATGLDCLAVRNRMGAWCGYVGITEGHPLFGVGYSTCSQPNCDAEFCYEHTPDNILHAHGGITYSDFCQESMPESEGICHLPFDGRPDRVWWFGFDTVHGGDVVPEMTFYGSRFNDGGTYRDLPYIREQCRDLARQLAQIG